MAIKGIKIGQEIDFESDHDDAKGTPEATVFKLRVLDGILLGHLVDKAGSAQKAGDMEAAREIVSYGLGGWERFRDDDGNDIAFKTVKRMVGGVEYPAIHTDALKLIPVPVQFELSMAIINANRLTKEEAKN